MEKEIRNLFRQLNECQFEESTQLLTEDSDLTYYELRKFITLLYKTVKEKETKVILGEILKSLTVMELKRLPVSIIKKLKSQSPKIFQ